MSRLLHEQVSAFMDGELPAEECELLLRRLAANRELARRWHAYHLIGDAMRGQLVSSAAGEIAPRVGEALSARDSARSAHRGPRRLAMVAAGVAVLGLAGVVGGLVSQQMGGGKVFTSGGDATTARALGGTPTQVNWQQTPTPVRAELDQYLMMHDLYGPVPSVLAGGTGNAVVMTTAVPLPVAGTGRGLNDPR